MVKINSIDDLDELFPDEESVKKYLCELRWGKFASCPYCNNEKAYFIENGKRFKCANKKCYKKFSVTVKTLMEATNIPLTKWMQIVFIYVKTRGRCMSWDFEKQVNINSSTAMIVKDKLDFVWAKVLREGKQNLDVINDVFKTLFYSYDSYDNFKSVKYKTASGWHEKFKGINDITNPQHYSILCFYVKVYMWYTKYIFINFASPEDIIAETFIWLKDNNIKDYDSDMLIKYINRTISRMWTKYLNTHHKYHEQLRYSNRRSVERGRMILQDWYITRLIKITKEGKGMTSSEIRANKQLMENKKKEVIAKRKKGNREFGWISHFD